MVDFTPILEAIIALLAALITAKVIPWIRERTSTEQQYKIDAAVRTAVYAAEQVYGAGRGDEKLQYAVNYLRRNGYKVDLAVIEAAVQMHFRHFEVAPAEPDVPAQEAPESNDTELPDITELRDTV